MESRFVDVVCDHYDLNGGLCIPRLAEWFEDFSHVRTGKIKLPDNVNAFKVYYHATATSFGSGESTEAVIFEIDIADVAHNLKTATAPEKLFRRAVKM